MMYSVYIIATILVIILLIFIIAFSCDVIGRIVRPGRRGVKDTSRICEECMKTIMINEQEQNKVYVLKGFGKERTTSCISCLRRVIARGFKVDVEVYYEKSFIKRIFSS